jgi:AcrR family transcriptional regulator
MTAPLDTPMPTPSLLRRERQREETRARILEAARELFVANGVAATTMRAIAARIEYTPTAIYHHFRDKDALLAELCTNDFLALAGAFQRIGRIEDPIERIRRIGIAYVDFALDNKSQYQFLFMTPSSHVHGDGMKYVEKNNPEQDAYAFLRASVEEALKRGLFRTEFQDPDQLAQILWGGLHGIVALHIVKEHDDWIAWAEPRATARLAVDVLLRGTRRAEPA